MTLSIPTNGSRNILGRSHISATMQASATSLADCKVMRNAGDGIHRSPVGAALGFLVADPDLNPISANEEAIAILTYPSKQAHEESIAEAFNKKIRSRLPPGSSRKQVSAIIQFKSGRRNYFCRAFPLDGNGRVFNSPAVLLVLERGMSGALAVSQIAAKAGNGYVTVAGTLQQRNCRRPWDQCQHGQRLFAPGYAQDASDESFRDSQSNLKHAVIARWYRRGLTCRGSIVSFGARAPHGHGT